MRGGADSRRRVVSERPNVVKRAVKPSTPDEVQLASRVVAAALSQNSGLPWDKVICIAATEYNIEVCRNTVEADNPLVQTRGYLGSTTAHLLNKYWIDASKYASGPIRDASSLVPGGGGGGGGQRSSGLASKKITPAGAAKPGEIFHMTEEAINKLGVRALLVTVRSLEGGACANNAGSDNLKRMLVQAVRDRKKRKIE